MHAAVIHETGGVPAIEEFEEPAGDGNEVVVEIELAGLNPIDLWMADGDLGRDYPAKPYVAGLEGIGRVNGGPLAYFGGATNPFGSFAPKALVKSDRLIELPEGVDPAQALAFGIAGQAGWLSVAYRSGLQAGETVVVLGASGIAGLIAVQAARALAAGHIIAVARSQSGLERAREVGADRTIQLEADPAESLTERLIAATGNPADVVIDMLWGGAALAALEATGEGGRLVQVGNSSGEKEITIPARSIRGQAREIRGHTNGLVPDDVRRDAYLEMCRRSIAGELSVATEEVPLTEIPDAWARQRQGPGRKLVIRP